MTAHQRRWFRFSLRALLACVTLIALGIGLWRIRGYLPGTISLDSSGVAHGTGVARYYFDTGELQLEDHYFNGLMTRKVWYRRDGSVAVTSNWDKQLGGKFHVVRDDGTIERTIQFKYSAEDADYVAEPSHSHDSP